MFTSSYGCVCTPTTTPWPVFLLLFCAFILLWASVRCYLQTASTPSHMWDPQRRTTCYVCVGSSPSGDVLLCCCVVMGVTSFLVCTIFILFWLCVCCCWFAVLSLPVNGWYWNCLPFSDLLCFLVVCGCGGMAGVLWHLQLCHAAPRLVGGPAPGHTSPLPSAGIRLSELGRIGLITCWLLRAPQWIIMGDAAPPLGHNCALVIFKTGHLNYSWS